MLIVFSFRSLSAQELKVYIDWYAHPGYYGAVALNDGRIVVGIQRNQIGEGLCKRLTFYYFSSEGVVIDSVTINKFCDEIWFTYTNSSLASDGRNIYFRNMIQPNIHTFEDHFVEGKWMVFDAYDKTLDTLSVLNSDDIDSAPITESYMYIDTITKQLVFKYQNKIQIVPYDTVGSIKNFGNYNFEKATEINNSRFVSNWRGRIDALNIRSFKMDTLAYFLDSTHWGAYPTGIEFNEDTLLIWGRSLESSDGHTETTINSVVLENKTDLSQHFRAIKAYGFPCVRKADTDNLFRVRGKYVAASFFTAGLGDIPCGLTWRPDIPNWYGVFVMDFAGNILDTIAFREEFTYLTMVNGINDSTIVIGGIKENHDGLYQFARVIHIPIPKIATNKVHSINYKVNLFPNPVSDYLQVHVDTWGILTDIRIYDTSGRMTRCVPATMNDPIDVSDMTPGIYFVRCGLRDGRVKGVGRFVKL